MNNLFKNLLNIYLQNWQLLVNDNVYSHIKNYYKDSLDYENNLPLLKYDINKLLPNFSSAPEQVKIDLSNKFEDITFKEKQTTGILSLLLSSYKIFWLALPNAFIEETPSKIEIGDMDTTVIPIAAGQILYKYTIHSLKLYSTKSIIPQSLLCFFKTDNSDVPLALFQNIPVSVNDDKTSFNIDFTDDIDYTSIDIPLTNEDLLNKLDNDYSINRNNFRIIYATSNEPSSFSNPENKLVNNDTNEQLKIKRISVSTDYTTSNDAIIGVNTTSSPITITLSSTDCVEGKVIIIKDEGGNALINNITVVTEKGKTIDGTTTITINTNYGVLRLYSDGNNWFSF